MMVSNAISDFNDDKLELELNEEKLEKFIEPFLIKYPDYYNLRGDKFKDLPEPEKMKGLKILKLEFF